MADKKSRKYLSVLQAFSAPTAFVCATRVFIPAARRFSAPTAHYPCRKRLPLAVFPANETPRAYTRGVSL